MKKSITFFLAIAVLHFSTLTFPSELSQCRSYLQGNLTDPDTRQAAISFIREIKNNREFRYLDPTLYPDLCKCYGKLQGKLGDYYLLKEGNFTKAIECYEDADTYSQDSYTNQIAACRLAKAGGITQIDSSNMNQQDIFDYVQQLFKSTFIKQMTLLRPIDKFKIENAKKYLSDQDWADNAIRYADIYKQMMSLAAVKRLDIRTMKSRLDEINNIQQLNIEIKEKIENYLDLWNDYFQIRDGTSFSQRLEASRSKYKKLQEIKNTAQQIEIFGINKRVSHIERMIQNVLEDEKRLLAQKEETGTTPKDEKKSVPPPGDIQSKKPKPKSEKPKEEKKIKAEDKPTPADETPPPVPKPNPSADFKKLEEMWKQVKKKKFEPVVRGYIHKNTWFPTQGVKSAGEKLSALFKLHNKWRNLDSVRDEIRAVQMIGEMQTLADNPREQNNAYHYILERFANYDKEVLGVKNKKILEEINQITRNNKIYLQLYKAWKTKNQENLDPGEIEKSLDYRLLTIEQTIQAHYMLGYLNEKKKENTVPACYHYGSAFQLMNANKISSLHLLWKKVVIERAKLKEKVCEHCIRIKKIQEAMKLFQDKYKDKGVDIETLTQACPDSQKIKPTEPKPKKEPSISIHEFLDRMFEYIKTSGLDDPDMKQICQRLLKSKLTGKDFAGIKEEYQENIPVQYDLLMNSFMQTIFLHNEGWRAKAEALLDTGGWEEDIKTKLRAILSEAKLRF